MTARGRLVLVAALAALVAVAAGAAALTRFKGTDRPHVPRGQGEACVADTDWIRRNHMVALDRQRDATVHEGLRTPRFSLAGCLACHAVAGEDGRAVTAADSRHFCRVCHDYAAVRVDCFDCHASRPERMAEAAGSKR